MCKNHATETVNDEEELETTEEFPETHEEPEVPRNPIDKKYEEMIEQLEKELEQYNNVDRTDEVNKSIYDVCCKVVQEQLNVNIEEMKKTLGVYVDKNAEELSRQFVNIAPHGYFSKLLEDNDSMCDFLRAEAIKPETWKLKFFTPSDINPNLMQFTFQSSTVDSDDMFEGFVYVTLSGKIKHAFAKGEEKAAIE